MDKEILLKQLSYRSNHRGCKETDILLGVFFNQKHHEFDDKKLELYRSFIEEDDMMIYDWILAKTEIPKKYYDLALEIKAFHRI